MRSSVPPSGLPRARVRLEPPDRAPVEVLVEVANTQAARARGLMFRRSMPADHGMLFIFDRMEQQSFWMRNTFLRLDILFIDDQGQVVGVIPNAPPLTHASQAVDAPSQYVLEVHGGFAAAHGLTAGTHVRFLDLPENLDVPN